MILVIDDDPVQRLLARGVLEKAGHHVAEAADGLRGLEVARQSVPDLIVCDVLMPGLNGYQLVAALRHEADLSTIPVVMLTSLAERSHVRIGMTAGADDYIAKPFSASDLQESVAAVLAKRKMQRDSYVGAVKDKLIAALDEQKQSLALTYELRLARELNDRWSREGDRNAELVYEDATVLVVDLFASIMGPLASREDAARTVRHAYQAARDCLYLFDARHVLPFGGDLLAVFADVTDQPANAGRTRLLALRSAAGLQQAIRGAIETASSVGAGRRAGLPAIAVALHSGPVTLLHVSDPLHGDEGSILATGETVQIALRLREYAGANGWPVASTSAVMASLPAPGVTTGRTAVVTPGAGRAPITAVEVLAPG